MHNNLHAWVGHYPVTWSDIVEVFKHRQVIVTTIFQLMASLTLVVFYPVLFAWVSLQKWLGNNEIELSQNYILITSLDYP